MKINRKPYRPDIKKRIGVINDKNRILLRTILMDRIHNRTKERLERIYFRLGGNAWMIYEKGNSQQVMN